MSDAEPGKARTPVASNNDFKRADTNRCPAGVQWLPSAYDSAPSNDVCKISFARHECLDAGFVTLKSYEEFRLIRNYKITHHFDQVFGRVWNS